MNTEYKCNDCRDTGWVGDNGPGKRGNNEYMPCDCAKGKAIAVSIKNRPASEIPTADLIAELERRRPLCNDCGIKIIDECTHCFWYESIRKDNFTPTTKEKDNV